MSNSQSRSRHCEGMLVATATGSATATATAVATAGPPAGGMVEIQITTVQPDIHGIVPDGRIGERRQQCTEIDVLQPGGKQGDRVQLSQYAPDQQFG